jgi:hypothetical protein
MDPSDAAYEAKIFGSPAPAAKAPAPMGNSLTDSNFGQAVAEAKTPMPTMTGAPAPVGGVPISAPEHHYSHDQQQANAAQQNLALQQGMGNNAGPRQ